MGNKQKGKIQKIIKQDTEKRIGVNNHANTQTRQRVEKERKEVGGSFAKTMSLPDSFKEKQVSTIKANRERRLQKYGSI